jgi:hypothetical protein
MIELITEGPSSSALAAVPAKSIVAAKAPDKTDRANSRRLTSLLQLRSCGMP